MPRPFPVWTLKIVTLPTQSSVGAIVNLRSPHVGNTSDTIQLAGALSKVKNYQVHIFLAENKPRQPRRENELSYYGLNPKLITEDKKSQNQKYICPSIQHGLRTNLARPSRMVKQAQQQQVHPHQERQTYYQTSAGQRHCTMGTKKPGL